MSRAALAVFAAAFALLCVLVGVSPTQASVPAQGFTPAQIALSVPQIRIDANTDFQLNAYSASLGRGTKVYLQRQMGTSHKFQTVSSAPRVGDFTVPGVAMGKYVYRLTAIRNGVTIITSVPHAVYSYGNLSAAQLCARSEYTYFDSCDGGTVPVGDRVFAYSNIGYSGNTGPDGAATVEASRSSCRSATLQYAVENSSADAGATGVGSALSQQNTDRQTSTGGVRVVSTAVFEIDSAAWDLAFWTEGVDTSPVYWAGTFNCYTTNGDR
ncbi:MAG: hypothetical protein ACXVXO_12075 [Mycobacteriaceae bacterium]